MEPNADLGMNRVSTAPTNPPAAHTYWTLGRGDSDRAFRSARRHSRWVRVLRVAIPLAVVLALSVVFLLAYFNPLRMLNRLPIDIHGMAINGTKIAIDKPHLAGFTRDARSYDLSADAAKQDLTKPDVIELTNLHAKIQMKDKSLVTLSAAAGVYDSKGETLKLDRNIVITSPAYTGRLSEADVNIRSGHVVSKQPVQVNLLQGTLNAKQLEILNSGDLVRFGGGVDMVLTLGEASAPQAKTGVH